MEGLDKILCMVKEKFSPRKVVDFKEQGLHFEMETLASVDEIKIIEYCKDFDGAQYIEQLKKSSLACAIKRINDNDVSGDQIEYTDEEGNKKAKSKFLYMIDFLGKWPSFMIDLLFNAFTDMEQEAEYAATNSVKFERFKIAEKPEESKKPVLRKVVETEGPLTETEKLNRQVERELSQESSKMSDMEAEALLKVKK